MIVVCAPSPKMTRQSNRGLPMVVASAVDHASAGLAPLSRSDEWNLRFAGAPDCRRQLRHRHVASDHTTRADHRIIANSDLYDIENHAVEVQEHTRTETDIEAVVAVKRWPNHSALADCSKALQQ